MRWVFNKLDKDGSGFLICDEILDVVSNEVEFDVFVENILDLFIYFVIDDDKKVDFFYCVDKYGIYF